MAIRRYVLLLFLSILTQVFTARIQSAAVSHRNAKRAATKQASAAAAASFNETKKDHIDNVNAAVNASLLAQDRFVDMASSKWVHTSRAHEQATVVGIAIFIVVLIVSACKLGSLLSSEQEESRGDKSAKRTKDTLKKLRRTQADDAAQAHLARQQHFHGDRLVYEWSQNNEVAKVYIKTPADLNAEELEIFITQRRLSVGRKGKSFFLNEATYDAVDVDESAWRLHTSGELQIHMHKETPGDWPQVLVPDSAESTES